MKKGTALAGVAGMVWAIGLAGCGEKNGGEEGGGTRAPAESGYVLAKPNALPPTGTNGLVTSVMSMRDAPMTVEAGEQKMVGTMTTTTDKRMKYEVISPSKVKVMVEKDVDTQMMVMDESPQPRPPEVSPIQGIPLTFELKDGEWVAGLEAGGELNEEQKGKLGSIQDQLSGEEAVGLYGTEPRKAGDEWEVDPKNLPGMGDGADFTGRYHLKFDRIEEHAGHRCAVMLGTLDVVGSPSEGDAKGLEIRITASSTTFRSLEHLEDLKLEIRGEMSMTGSPSAGVSMAVRGPLLLERITTLTLP